MPTRDKANDIRSQRLRGMLPPTACSFYCPLSCCLSPSIPRAHTHGHSLTHSHTRARAHTHTHTHTHSLSLSLSLSLSSLSGLRPPLAPSQRAPSHLSPLVAAPAHQVARSRSSCALSRALPRSLTPLPSSRARSLCPSFSRAPLSPAFVLPSHPLNARPRAPPCLALPLSLSCCPSLQR